MRQIKKIKDIPLSSDDLSIEIPKATTDTLGGIIVGNNLSIDENGRLNASAVVIDGDGNIAGGEVLPIGTMLPYGSADNIPSNWKICDGSEVSRTTYSELFKVIGTSYGEGDGETTFNLPDKRGRVSVGLNSDSSKFNAVGKKAGEETVKLTANEMPSHSHTISSSRGNTTWSYGVLWSRAAAPTEPGMAETIHYAGNTGGGQAHNNLQPYEVDVWIIKVSNIVSVLEETTGTIIDNLTSTSSTDALSANMGRELNERITSIEENGVGGDSMVTYSTEEQRIGTWIDGKPLYRITLNMGSVSGSAVYSHGIANLHRVVNAFGTFLQSSGHMEPLPKVVINNAAWSADFADFTATTFVLNFGSNIGTATEVTLTIEYTKTTD